MPKNTGKKQLGQYFTVSETLQQYVFNRVKHKGSMLLEPSFGAGHLLSIFKTYDENYPMTCYEIDAEVKPVVSWNTHQTVIYGDFLTQQIPTKYKTVIGNPPYVKQKGGKNLYITFLERCFDLLESGGEMIMIVPSDFLKLTSAAPLLISMTEQGAFTDFLFPNDETLFPGANVDVVAFRYEKGCGSDTALVNGQERRVLVNQGIVTFATSENIGDGTGKVRIEDVCHVYVGIVSGRDEIYRVPFGNIQVLQDKDKVESYIYTEQFPTNDLRINDHLEKNKAALLERKIRKFTEKNWFEWGAPRNITSIQKYWGKSCIYVRNMTRQKTVAFMGNVQYFGGTLLCLVPKEEGCDLQKICDTLNSAEFQKDYIYAGRFKIGHKQVSNVFV